MSGSTAGLRLARESSGAMLSLARRDTPSRTRRIPTADVLMAPPCEVVLPTLESVPPQHC